MKRQTTVRDFDISPHFSALLSTVFAFFLSSGTYLTVDALFEKHLPLSEIILCPAIILFVLFLITRTKTVFFISLPAILVILLLLFAAGAIPVAQYIKIGILFLKNIYVNVVFPDSPHVDGAFRFLCVVIYFVICLSYFLFSVYMRTNWATLIAAFSFFMLNWLVSPKATVLWVVVLLLAGFVPQLAQKQFFRNRFGQTASTKYKAAITGAAVFALFCAIVLSVFPKDTQNLHLRQCTDLMAEAQSATKSYPEKVKNKSRLSLKYFDLQDDSGRIDCPVHTNKQSGYLAEVVDTRNRYFRYCTFDTFNGARWYNSETDYYRINGFFKDEQNAALSLSDKVKQDPTFKKYFEKQEIAIALMGEQKFLYTTGNLEDFQEISYSNNTVLFDNRGEVFSPWTQKSGYTYAFSTYQTNKDTFILDPDVVKELDQMIERMDAGMPEDFFDKYTALPKQWSTILSKQADEIPVCGYFETVNKCLEVLFYHNIRVVNEPERKDKNYSPLDQMVLTKTGNCVQYSTALCMMLRANGIPTRLVAGYFSAMPEKATTFYLSADKSITWIEIYCPGIGWVEINSIYPLDNELEAPNQSNSPKENDIPEKNEEDDKGDPAKKPQNKPAVFKYMLVALSVLLALAVVLLVLRYVISCVFFSKRFVSLIYKSTAAQYLFYYRDMLNLLRLFDIPVSNKDTLRTASEKLSITLDTEIDGIYLQKAERVCYAAYIPAKADVLQVYLYLKQVEKTAKARCSIVKFVVHRRIFRPLFVLSKNKRRLGKNK